MSMRLLLHTFHIWSVTILGIPGWAPTDDTQPKAWVKAHLGCNPSHQVWTVGTSGKGNTLSYQRVFPLDPYVHMQAGVAHVTVHLGGKDRLGLSETPTLITEYGIFLIFYLATAPHHVESSAAHQVRSLGAYRLYL